LHRTCRDWTRRRPNECAGRIATSNGEESIGCLFTSFMLASRIGPARQDTREPKNVIARARAPWPLSTRFLPEQDSCVRPHMVNEISSHFRPSAGMLRRTSIPSPSGLRSKTTRGHSGADAAPGCWAGGPRLNRGLAIGAEGGGPALYEAPVDESTHKRRIHSKANYEC
jgi:hypothetical protein